VAAKKKKKTPAPKKKASLPKRAAKARAKKPAQRAPARRDRRKAGPAKAESDEHAEVYEIFRTYDRDDSGSIDSQEFARLLDALGHDANDDELLIALDVVDTNASGRISWSEFRAWWVSR
jgi:EF-hand domain pair